MNMTLIKKDQGRIKEWWENLNGACLQAFSLAHLLPPFEVGQVGFAGPPTPHATPAEGVPPGPGARRANKALGHARLQARLTCLPNQHVRLLGSSHHNGMGPRSYLVRVPGQGSGGVPLVPTFVVAKLDSPRKRDVCQADSGYLPDAEKAYRGKGCKGPEEGPIPRLGRVLHEYDQPGRWKVWLGSG